MRIPWTEITGFPRSLARAGGSRPTSALFAGFCSRRSSGASSGGIRSERWREWSVEMIPQRCVGKLQGIRPRQADFHWDAFLGQEFQQFFGWPRRPRSRF
ncbi:unnamed protein product [Gadus morhua 'NCC']